MEKRFSCPLMGTKYYTVERPKVGDTVLLVPEPKNEFDENAIAVYNSALEQVGYVRQRANTSRYVASKLKGKPAYAQISHSDSDKDNPIILIDIRFLAD
jgi:hypothetical protein